MTVYDYILIAILVALLPAEALWKSLRASGRPKPSMTTRLLRSIRVIVILLVLLFAIWWREDRPLALLGLDVPLSTAGLIGLAATASILLLLIVAGRSAKAQTSDADAAVAAADMLPKTRNETRLFILFAFIAGAGWELLYRGYLLWAMTPTIGIVGAVVVAAIAYALGHGSKDTKSLIGSTISAFLFTIGYALTGSLWWLIVLHTALPLMGLVAMRSMSPARTT